MISDFNSPSFEEPSGEWIDINENNSGRYRFYKTRLFGRLHFVKTLSEEKQADLVSIEALRKEFTIGYSLDHPSIVRYLKFDGNAIYEEYVDGKSLRQMLDECDELLHDKKFISKVCCQLLEAVEYMHGMGVLHLDIKPDNVMITRVGNQVKIIDFGCAYTATDDTTQGFTLQYKAPEQGKTETNGYTDIYLVGKTIQELAANAGCLRQWKKFIRKATAENPRDRFRTEKEATDAIPKYRERIAVRDYAIICVLVITVLGLLKVLQKNEASEPINNQQIATNIITEIPDTTASFTKNRIDERVVESQAGPSEIQQREIILDSEAVRRVIEQMEEEKVQAQATLKKWMQEEVRKRCDLSLVNIRPVCETKIDESLPRKQWKEEEDSILEKIYFGNAEACGFVFDTLKVQYPEYSSFLYDLYVKEDRRYSIQALKLYIEANPKTTLKVRDE